MLSCLVVREKKATVTTTQQSKPSSTVLVRPKLLGAGRPLLPLVDPLRHALAQTRLLRGPSILALFFFCFLYGDVYRRLYFILTPILSAMLSIMCCAVSERECWTVRFYCHQIRLKPLRDFCECRAFCFVIVVRRETTWISFYLIE